MSETLKTAFDTLERKITALGEEKNRFAEALQASEAQYQALQVDFANFKQGMEQENARLSADNALLSEKLNKLISRVESMSQNF